jgi:hypothetical protein
MELASLVSAATWRFVALRRKMDGESTPHVTMKGEFDTRCGGPRWYLSKRCKQRRTDAV